MCHVLSCSPCRRRSSAVPFLHMVPSVAFRSAPFRPRPRRPGRPQAAGPFLRAYRACAPLRGRARLVPARFVRLNCARETADARLPSPPAGAFCRPQPLLPRAEKRKGGPGSRLLSTCILLHFFPDQALWQVKYEIFLILRKKDEQRKPLPIYPVAHADNNGVGLRVMKNAAPPIAPTPGPGGCWTHRFRPGLYRSPVRQRPRLFPHPGQRRVLSLILSLSKGTACRGKPPSLDTRLAPLPGMRNGRAEASGATPAFARATI